MPPQVSTEKTRRCSPSVSICGRQWFRVVKSLVRGLNSSFILHQVRDVLVSSSLKMSTMCLQQMLATLCNILLSCDIHIPPGSLPPIVWHSPANFVGELLLLQQHFSLHTYQIVSDMQCKVLAVWQMSQQFRACRRNPARCCERGAEQVPGPSYHHPCLPADNWWGLPVLVCCTAVACFHCTCKDTDLNWMPTRIRQIGM